MKTIKNQIDLIITNLIKSNYYNLKFNAINQFYSLVIDIEKTYSNLFVLLGSPKDDPAAHHYKLTELFDSYNISVRSLITLIDKSIITFEEIEKNINLNFDDFIESLTSSANIYHKYRDY